jgi:predicted acyl esterase
MVVDMEKKQIFVFIAIIMLVLVAITSGCVEKSTVKVSMEDGVRLATDIYTSNISKGTHGSILIRTPYDKYKMTYVGKNRALFGWPTVIQNMRGRFDSEGNDTVFRNENTDGATTLAWMANQSWSNGKIATWGGSALGIAQYLMAGENPPELACQFIQVATPNMHKNLYHGGQFRYQLAYKWLEFQDSLHVLPELYNNENYSLEWWENVSLEDNWQDVNVPAIHIGGWYDCFAQGIVDGFMGYQYNGGSGAQGKSKLIMGPWTHSGSFGTNQGQLVYPENSLDTFSEGLFMQMIRQYTMNKATSFDDWPAVYYYVMSDVDDPNAPGNEWRSADKWPLQHSEAKWYFHQNGVLSTNNPSEYDPLLYKYDPSNPVPTVGGQNLCMPAGPYNQIFIENRSDVLVFTSDELVEPYEATGPIKAKLFVSSDCPDTDITVKLTDVYPDGRSMLICDGILRMRNRNGVDHWEFMEPGEVYEVEVDLWSSSYIWNTGHKIRVAISSSNYPRFLNNPNTKDAVAKNTTYNIAQNTLYLDSQHPSCIILPEIDQQEMKEQINTPNIKNSYGSLRENLRNLIIKFFYRSRLVQDDELTNSYQVNYGYN